MIQKKNSSNLTEGKVPQLLAKLTLPMIFGMFSTIAFNMVDTYFVAMLGTNELAAMTFTFPIVMIISALAQGIGIATSTLISRAIGENNRKTVIRYTVDSLLLGVFLVLICAVAGILTIDPLFTMMGASADLIPYIREYMEIWYIGTLFIVIPMIGNSAIRALGNTKTPSMIMMVSAVVNLILDPILIFGFASIPAMGIRGAAIATVIARATTLVVSLNVLARKEKIISLEGIGFSAVFGSWRKLLYLGLPNAFTKMLTPIAGGIITGCIALFGKEAVAAFGIASKVEMFALLVSGALATVIAPFIGQNIGAGKWERVREAIKVSENFQMVFNTGVAFLLMIFGKQVAQIFTSNPEVIAIVQNYLYIVPLSYGFQGILQVNTTAYNIMNKPITAAAIMVLRMFAVYIPMAWISAKYVGIQGIWLSMLISFALAAIVTHFMLKMEMADTLERENILI